MCTAYAVAYVNKRDCDICNFVSLSLCDYTHSANYFSATTRLWYNLIRFFSASILLYLSSIFPLFVCMLCRMTWARARRVHVKLLKNRHGEAVVEICYLHLICCFCVSITFDVDISSDVRAQWSTICACCWFWYVLFCFFVNYVLQFKLRNMGILMRKIAHR